VHTKNWDDAQFIVRAHNVIRGYAKQRFSVIQARTQAKKQLEAQTADIRIVNVTNNSGENVELRVVSPSLRQIMNRNVPGIYKNEPAEFRKVLFAGEVMKAGIPSNPRGIILKYNKQFNSYPTILVIGSNRAETSYRPTAHNEAIQIVINKNSNGQLALAVYKA